MPSDSATADSKSPTSDVASPNTHAENPINHGTIELEATAPLQPDDGWFTLTLPPPTDAMNTITPQRDNSNTAQKTLVNRPRSEQKDPRPAERAMTRKGNMRRYLHRKAKNESKNNGMEHRTAEMVPAQFFTSRYAAPPNIQKPLISEQDSVPHPATYTYGPPPEVLSNHRDSWSTLQDDPMGRGYETRPVRRNYLRLAFPEDDSNDSTFNFSEYENGQERQASIIEQSQGSGQELPGPEDDSDQSEITHSIHWGARKPEGSNLQSQEFRDIDRPERREFERDERSNVDKFLAQVTEQGYEQRRRIEIRIAQRESRRYMASKAPIYANHVTPSTERDTKGREPESRIINATSERYEPFNFSFHDLDTNELSEWTRRSLHRSPYHLLSNVATDENLQVNYHVSIPVMYADQGTVTPKAIIATTTTTTSSSPHQDDESIRSLPFHHHSELSGSSCIRVLRIEPGNSGEMIQCQLLSHNLDSPSFDFNALSYHWGSSDVGLTDRTVICDGYRKKVGLNLFEALEAVRNSTEPTLLWADAICINQEDTSERNYQVSLMQRIYRQASKVIVWAGSSTTTSEIVLALDLVCNLANRYPPRTRETAAEATYELLGQQNPKRTEPTDKLPHHDAEDWRMVAKLFDQHWFWRVWVIQETVLASHIIVRWGAASIDFRWIGLAAAWIRTNEAKFLEKYPTTGVYNAYLMYRLRMADWKMSFIQILQHTRQFEVTDPRDRVYGLLGLPTIDHNVSTGKLYMEPDYNLNCGQVYTALATKALCERKDLSVLSSVQHGAHDFRNPSIASWVANWDSCEGHTLAPPHAHAPHMTSFGTEPDIRRMDESIYKQIDVHCGAPGNYSYPMIRIKGIKVGAVECCMPRFIKTSLWTSSTAIVYDGVRDMILKSSHPHETLAWTITAGKDWYGTRISDVDDHLRQFRILMDSLGAGGTFAAHDNTPSTTEEPEHALPSEPKPDRSSLSIDKFMDAAARACISRRFFWTADGRLGLGPAMLDKGDIVCILFGGHMPYVLRPDGESRYRFLGECYVYDVMDGQAVEEWRRTNQPATYFDLY